MTLPAWISRALDRIAFTRKRADQARWLGQWVIGDHVSALDLLIERHSRPLPRYLELPDGPLKTALKGNWNRKSRRSSPVPEQPPLTCCFVQIMRRFYASHQFTRKRADSLTS